MVNHSTVSRRLRFELLEAGERTNASSARESDVLVADLLQALGHGVDKATISASQAG